MSKDRKIKVKNIILASDHAGFKLKEDIKNFLIKKRKKVMDLGTYNSNSVDYPVFAHRLSRKIRKNKKQFGILICGSGVGMSIVANRYKNVRAALCWNEELAVLAKQHNNANIVCIPARFISKEEALQIVKSFIQTGFEGGRHERRVNKI